MAEQPSPLADFLQGRQPQNLDALANSLPPAQAPSMLNHVQDGHRWLMRNVLEPVRYATHYPERVLQRAWPDTFGGRTDPRRLDAFIPTIEGIDQLGQNPGYSPGARQSTNVEDRRPRSIWEY